MSKGDGSFLKSSYNPSLEVFVNRFPILCREISFFKDEHTGRRCADTG
jgi:hypothetical protein